MTTTPQRAARPSTTTKVAPAFGLVLVALVPVLLLARARDAAPAGGEPTTAEIWQALESAGSPAVVMQSGGRTDAAVTIWRSGPSQAQQSLVAIAPDPDMTSRYLATSAVYAWSSVARLLSMRGMLVAPLRTETSTDPLLWRVLQFERCQPITTAWVDAMKPKAMTMVQSRR